MAYRYGIKNAYRPSALSPRAYGWSGAPAYNQADVPTALMDRPDDLTADQFRQQFAYEWFQSAGVQRGYSNPPFASGASGRLNPVLESESGGPPRILRGYIRRAQFDSADPVSRTRLYFMYNPEQITRDYVSYLEQSALDPFNTIYQSGNLVAPPAILDFTFSLIFDRQEEATQRSHPGVLVDYEFFDLVVRNVIPDPNSPNSTAIPDNGVMMVNPRDITVVFSPQMTVQGRPTNAKVSFLKFTHRMVPTRMQIDLTIRASYLGPVRDMTEYKAEQFAAEASIPLDEVNRPDYIFNMQGVIDAVETTLRSLTGFGVGDPTDAANYGDQQNLAVGGNADGRKAALDWARAHVIPGSTRYNANGASRYNLPTSADCSGLITEAYKQVGLATGMNWNDHPGTAVIISRLQSNGYKNAIRYSYNDIYSGKLQYGDIIIRNGHVRFFMSYQGGNAIQVFDAASVSSNPQVGPRTLNSKLTTDYFAFRPMPLGQDMSYNAVNAPTSRTAR